MRKEILKYVEAHSFCPSFDLIFTGSEAVISIKHLGTTGNVGHERASYGTFFWLRLMFSIRRCYKNQIGHSPKKEDIIRKEEKA